MKNNELHHFGKKGMKWGVRNVINKATQPYRTHKEVQKKYKDIMTPTKDTQKRNTKKSLLVSALIGSLFLPAGPLAYNILNSNVRQTKKEAKKLAKKLVKTKSKDKYETYLDRHSNIGIRKVKPKKKK